MSDYNINFRREVYKELAAHVSGFVFRNYIYLDKPLPPQVKAIKEEAMRIECRDILNYDTHEKLDALEKRLLEMKDYIHAVTPLPHR